MRYLYFVFLVLASFFSLQSASAASPTMCTMEYAPVCGSVPVQCITTPCYPVRETFGNSCMARAAGATDIRSGECDGTPTIPPGGDSDIHGCKPSTGYTWNPLAKQCLRPWESKVRVITIAPDMKSCVFGVMKDSCLQMRSGAEKWSLIYGGIEGFDHVPGYIYRLRVLETRIDNPPADGAGIRYTLLKTLSKRLAPAQTDENLLGDWHMIGYDDISISALSSIRAEDLTLSFTKDRFSARICNTMNGSYRLTSGGIVTSQVMSTKMACPASLLSKMEGAWNLDGASYSIATARQMAGATGPSIWLTITTKDGTIFTYTR